MPARFLALALSCVLLAPAAVRADENVTAHSARPKKTVTIEAQQILPSDLTMDAGDVLVFQNFSFQVVQVTFIEPKDAATKIRCHLGALPKEKQPPWATFSVQGGNYTGLIPPGRFGSLCSFSPGRYAYTVKQLSGEATGLDGELPNKGWITVN